MTGPFLYDDEPAPLHTGTPRGRQGLLLAVLGGTVAIALLMTVVLVLVKGSPEEQAREATEVFVAALANGDTETSTGLLCEQERIRLAAREVGEEYARFGAGSVVSAREVRVDGVPHYEVEVRWSGGGSGELTVINEDGPSICGVTQAG